MRMSNIKYFALAGQGNPVHPSVEPKNAMVNAVWMDGSMIEGCMFNEASWYLMPCKEQGLIKHNSDKVMFFIGGNPDQPETLNSTVNLWIENDRLTQLARVYNEARDTEKAAAKQKQAAKAEMLTLIGDYEKVRGNGFKISAGVVSGTEISYFRQPYRGFTLTWDKNKE